MPWPLPAEAAAAAALNATLAGTLVSSLLRPDYWADPTYRETIDSFLNELEDGQRHKLKALGLLERVAKVKAKNPEQYALFKAEIEKEKSELKNKIGEECYLFGKCSIKDVTKYALTISNGIEKQICITAKDDTDLFKHCKVLQATDVEGGAQFKSRRQYDGSTVDSGDGKVDPDKITAHVQHHINYLEDLLVQLECPASMPVPQFVHCVVKQERLLRQTFPEYIDWGGTQSATTITPTSCPLTPNAAPSNTSSSSGPPPTTDPNTTSSVTTEDNQATTFVTSTVTIPTPEATTTAMLPGGRAAVMNCVLPVPPNAPYPAGPGYEQTAQCYAPGQGPWNTQATPLPIPFRAQLPSVSSASSTTEREVSPSTKQIQTTEAAALNGSAGSQQALPSEGPSLSDSGPRPWFKHKSSSETESSSSATPEPTPEVSKRTLTLHKWTEYCAEHPKDERCQVPRKRHMTMHSWMKYCGGHPEDTSCPISLQSAAKGLEVSTRHSIPTLEGRGEHFIFYEAYAKCKRNPHLEECARLRRPLDAQMTPSGNRPAEKLSERETHERQCKENPYLEGCLTGHIVVPPPPLGSSAVALAETTKAHEGSERQCKENPYLEGCHTGHVWQPPESAPVTLPAKRCISSSKPSKILPLCNGCNWGDDTSDGPHYVEPHHGGVDNDDGVPLARPGCPSFCKEREYEPLNNEQESCLRPPHRHHHDRHRRPGGISGTERESGRTERKGQHEDVDGPAEKRSVAPFRDFDGVLNRGRPGIDASVLEAQRQREREDSVVFQPLKDVEGESQPRVALEPQVSAFHSERPGDYPDWLCMKVEDGHCIEWSEPAIKDESDETTPSPEYLDALKGFASWSSGPEHIDEEDPTRLAEMKPIKLVEPTQSAVGSWADEQSQLPSFQKRDENGEKSDKNKEDERQDKKQDEKDEKKKEEDIWSMDVHDLVCTVVERNTVHGNHCIKWIPLSKANTAMNWKSQVVQELAAKFEQDRNERKERMERERIEREEKDRLREQCKALAENDDKEKKGGAKMARRGAQDGIPVDSDAVAELRAVASVAEAALDAAAAVDDALPESLRDPLEELKQILRSVKDTAKDGHAAFNGASKTQDPSVPNKSVTLTRRYEGRFPTSIAKTKWTEDAYQFWNCLNQHGQLDVVEWSKEQHFRMQGLSKPKIPYWNTTDEAKEKAALEKCFLTQIKGDIEKEQGGKGRSKFLQDFMNEALKPMGIDLVEGATAESKESSEREESSRVVTRDGLVDRGGSTSPQATEDDKKLMHCLWQEMQKSKAAKEEKYTANTDSRTLARTKLIEHCMPIAHLSRKKFTEEQGRQLIQDDRLWEKLFVKEEKELLADPQFWEQAFMNYGVLDGRVRHSLHSRWGGDVV